MAKLKFDAALVRRLVDHAKAAPEHRAGYGADPVPGLMLVGDDGVYLLSTGRPQMPSGDPKHPEGPFVVYAEGINPNVDGDDVWDRKREVFGGDDGVEVIPLAGGGVERALATAEAAGKPFLISITTKSLGVVEYLPVKKDAAPAKKPAKARR